MVTLREQSKRVNLMYEVCHARPSTEPESNHQDPHHHKHIHRVRPYPPPYELRWLLHCILHHNRSSQTVISYEHIPQFQFVCIALMLLLWPITCRYRQSYSLTGGDFLVYLPDLGNQVRTDIPDHRSSTNRVPFALFGQI